MTLPRRSAFLSALLILSVAAAPSNAAPTPEAKCSAAKLKAAGKKYASKAKCEAIAVLKNEPVSAECMQKAETKFVEAFAKADSFGSCPGTANDVEAGVDACLEDLVGQVVTSTTTTTLPELDPPAVASADDTSATSVNVVFDEPLDPGSVEADGSNFLLDNGGSVTSATLQIDGLTVTLGTAPLSPFVFYTVTASGVTDLAGNAVDAGSDSASFTHTPADAVVRINEVNANITNGCDLVELRVVQGGSMAGWTLQERNDATLVTFPTPFAVTTDTILVVHLNSGSSFCNPASCLTETTGPAQNPSATCSGFYDSAYDILSTDAGLTSTDNVLSLYDASDAFEDVVLLASSDMGSAAAGSELQAQAAATAGQWEIAGGGVPPGGFIDDDFRQHSALDLDATGTSAAGDSIQRSDDSDDNDELDWNVGADAIDVQSFGLRNAGQIAQCQ